MVTRHEFVVGKRLEEEHRALVELRPVVSVVAGRLGGRGHLVGPERHARLTLGFEPLDPIRCLRTTQEHSVELIVHLGGIAHQHVVDLLWGLGEEAWVGSQEGLEVGLGAVVVQIVAQRGHQRVDARDLFDAQLMNLLGRDVEGRAMAHRVAVPGFATWKLPRPDTHRRRIPVLGPVYQGDDLTKR